MDKKTWKKIDKYAKKIKAINYLGGSCQKCGENNIFKLCFHHLDTKEKEFEISDIKYYRWSIIEKEIKKCILLCSNCHSELHSSEIEDYGYRNKKIFLEFKGVDKCEKCGYDKCKSSLEFHHKNDDKDFLLSRVSINYKNIKDLTEKIENEINKCDVLCRNCHILEHSDFNFFEENKILIIERSLNIKENVKIDANKVIELYNNGMKQVDISRFFNVNKSTISGIIKRKK